MKKAIWIDVDNSPHVPLFAPLIRQYRDNGVEVIVTARNHAQTIELLQDAGLSGTFEIIGEHYGKSKFDKVRGLVVRSKQLVSFLNKNQSRVQVAVSHGSRSLVLAAKWLKIPIITMYDYEFTETTIFNRFSDKVLIPAKIPDKTLDEIGLPVSKRIKYQGLKEELYLGYFQPNEHFWPEFADEHQLNISEDTVLIALRPPATTANYHHENSEVLFRELLKYLLGSEKTFTIISPRTDEQRFEIERLCGELTSDLSRCLILKKAVKGLDLALNVDLMISGGGTMNREAVLLGTPVYSIFAGRQGALDRGMEKAGLITFIRQSSDLHKIRLEKAGKRASGAITGEVENCVKEQIEYWLNQD